MDTAADLAASKVAEKRRSCRPQRVLTKTPTPSTTTATKCAIFLSKGALSKQQRFLQDKLNIESEAMPLLKSYPFQQ